jgi:hypothetical protein
VSSIRSIASISTGFEDSRLSGRYFFNIAYYIGATHRSGRPRHERKWARMPNRSSNRPELRLLGSFRNFAVGSFRKSLASALRLQSSVYEISEIGLEHLDLFPDCFHQGAESFRKIFEILRADQSGRERIGAVFVKRRRAGWAQQKFHELDRILFVGSVLEHGDPPRDMGAWNGNRVCTPRCSQSW